VSAVGDLLELLHGAADRWTTVAATLRIWRRRELEDRARKRWEQSLARGGGVPGTVTMALFPAAQPPTGEHVETIRLWIAKPDRSRQEYGDSVNVMNGALWSSYHPPQGYLTNAGESRQGYSDPVHAFGHVFDPARLLPALEFDAPVERDGVLVVAARPRRGSRFAPPYGIGHGADEHELVVDPRLGVVLRTESRLEGEPFLVWELVDPSFDEELPDDLFTLTPPPGEKALTPGEIHAHGLSVEDAAERATFAVLAIPELPEGPWRLFASHSRPRGTFPELVSLLYHRADARGQILVTQFPAAAGHEHWDSGEARAEVDRDGTHVVLTSQDVAEDELRRLAETLVRV
jgi:outer membrane lipoprotein-sorting protein